MQMEKIKFRIGDPAHLETELKGMLEKQLILIGRYCTLAPEKPGEAVHEIRRCFKRSRAILRLIRDATGYAAYFRENRNMRDLHRRLTPAREADVFCQTLRDLRKNHHELLGDDWFLKVIDDVRDQARTELNQLLRDDTLEQISANVERSAERIGHYHLRGEGFAVIDGGLKRIYRQGQRLTHRAFFTQPDDMTLHNLRKRAKYLQYQVTLLRPLYPKLLKATAKSLQQLTDTLGNYNDRAEAKEKLPALVDGSNGSGGKLEVLFGRLTAEQEVLRGEARHLAQKIYAEKPGQFTGRIRTYWETHARERAENTEPIKTER